VRCHAIGGAIGGMITNHIETNEVLCGVLV
jgi:hypothetical protein